MNFFQIAQHAGDDLARRRGLQIQAQGHVKLIDQTTAPLVGLNALRQLLAAEGLAVKRVDHHLALGQVDLDHKVPRKANAPRTESQALGQLNPQHRQADRDAAAGAQHGIHITVVRVVVIVDVATKAELPVEEVAEQPQALQGRCIHRDAAFDAGQQLVDIAQHLLDVQLGVLVLRQAAGGFKQRKVLVALHQAGKVFKRRGNVGGEVHTITFA